ncbi:MAG: RAMP superfamily CRISPR-associated protein [Oscillospiraceae bacterium]|nr:RAMP superfamily CRISPR-associated protein [Oscillospiraceae bacterium]MDD6086278.1 RAMP superfamily CRISPR-associated protein [Oscillospiraceae bacterium]
MKQIKIELCSDLCIANGDGFGSVIDTDICTDEYGIPFIPSRRLKGCLKEAAEYIGSKNIDKIFGINGSDKSGSLKISDAYIKDYEVLKEEVVKKQYTPSKVTKIFTDIKASTAITEEGNAKENSLRFTRVVENILPWNKNEKLSFYADVFLDDNYITDFEKICKALRHIGFKRNRGYGIVKCGLYDSQKSKLKYDIPVCDKNKIYVLNYAIKNTSPLMIPGKSVNITQDYISGTSVIGMLAQEYLKTKDIDNYFNRLFLNRDVKFSNLYVSDEKLSEYIPVPGFLGKDKTDPKKRIFNTVTESKEIKEEGKIVKSFKDCYINAVKKIVKPETEIIYHNNMSEDGKDLYTQTCIKKGQYFRGNIIADGEAIREIADLIQNAEIRFGRSKTAQYSNCELVAMEISEFKNDRYVTGENVAFLFESDVIIADKYGNISTDTSVLAENLGIENIKEGNIHFSSNLKYKNISGFNTTIKIQKPQVRILSAGSVIVLRNTSKKYPLLMHVGEKQNEGYGKIRVFNADKFINEAVILKTKEQSKNENISKIEHLISEMDKNEEMRLSAIDYARACKKDLIDLNSSFIGRVTLMIEESKDHIDLDRRIKSIKNKKKMEKIDKVIKHLKSERYRSDWKIEQKYLTIVFTLAKYFIKQEGK